MLEEANLENRIQTLKEKLYQLLEGKKFWWKDMNNLLWKEIPEKPGVYVIITGNNHIYVGESTNLRNRLQIHGRGNINNDTFHKKLFKKELISKKEDRKKFVHDRCCFKFLEMGKEKDRKNFEHFTIAVVNPDLND